jgi:23S rRNA pseudouridine2605 synthase
MTQDQLHKARQTRWRQDGNALLTLDDAERWLADTPLCLFLPRRQHLPVPAPSFVEAIAGRPDPTPAPQQIAAASQMLARLVASGAVIALNLFGSGIAGEQPDFLATPEALQYLYALQPQRNPKKSPSTSGASRVSPLAVESFHILTREGALTAVELRERLGREVTEAATLRALGELWHGMRVVPVPDEQGAPAHWELLSTRHGRELNIGSTQSQTTALSILVSFYLQSAIAATAAEAEIFLSPLASRSRIRDVIHGLSTTRQLASFSLHGEEQFYVEGTLPEIIEEEETVTVAEANRVEASVDAGLEQNEPSFAEAAAAPPPATPRKRPSFGDRARGRFTSRPRQEQQRERPQRREGGFRRPERNHPERNGPEQRVPRTDSHPRREREDRPRPAFRPDRGARPAARSDREGAPKHDFEKRKSDRPNRGFERRNAGFDRGNRFQKRGPSQSQRPFEKRGPKPTSGPFPSGQFRGPGRPSRGKDERPLFRKDRPTRLFQNREGDRFEKRPPRREGERPYPPSGQRPPQRGPASGPGERRASERPDRPFQNREGDRFEKRPPRRESERPYPPSGQRPPRRGPAFPSGERQGSQRPGRPFRPKPASGERRPFPPGGERRPFRREGERAGFQKPGGRERSYSKPQDRPRSGGFKPHPQNAAPSHAAPGSPSDFRRSFGKPRPFAAGKSGNRPPGKSAFRPGKPGGARPFEGNARRFPSKRPEGNRPGGFTSRPRRDKPRKESGEGDEG